MPIQHTRQLSLAEPARAPIEVILLHGVGSDPASMGPLGQAIAAAIPGVRLRSPPAPFLRGDGKREWFRVDGITERNRIERLAAARAHVLDSIFPGPAPEGRWADRSMIVVGYSQGGIVALDLRDYLRWPRLHVVAVHARWADRHPPHAPLPGRAELISAAEDAVFPLELVAGQVAYRAMHGDHVAHRVSPGQGHAMSLTTLSAVVEAVERTRRVAAP